MVEEEKPYYYFEHLSIKLLLLDCNILMNLKSIYSSVSVVQTLDYFLASSTKTNAKKNSPKDLTN